MFGRLLCWIGFHDWGYRNHADGSPSRPVPHLTRGLAAHINRYGAHYECLRCGVEP